MVNSSLSVIWSYDNKSFPVEIQDKDVLSVNYYDDYSGIENCPKNTYDQSFISNSTVFTQPKGQLTASWVKSLNVDTGKNSGLWTVNFYDEKYRVVQSYAENYLGGYDYTTNAYDFVGKVERTIHKHTTGTTNITETKWFTYDHAGRMLKIEQQYTGSVNKDRVTIAEMEYDELGQLVHKNLPLVDRNLDYAYNIRGWMTQMNAVKTGSNSDFGFNLKYQSGATTFGGTNQFNGNIGAMEWWCSNLGDKNHRQAYGYQYDALNRITKADFRQNNNGWQNPVSTYDVDKITYDVNGNIQSLRRYGAGSTIDDLAYTYSGNQLLSVNDSGDDHYGFKELSDSSLEYGYDANGNMISDANKKISNVDYNLLNLPEVITKESQSIAYAYSATGEKLENRVSSSKKLQYCANFVYENGSLKYILNEEGKLDVGTTPKYQFFIKDHLGNTRVVLAEGGSTVTEVNHYYPFGMRMDMANLPKDAYQKYLYNGKELQEETDWLDYGWRMYDPQLGRWHCIDKLAENYFEFAPYVYCANNPIKLIDVDGRYFDDENEKRAQRLEKKLLKKQARLTKKITKMAAKGKDTADLEARQGQLDQSLTDIGDMRSNENTEFKYASLDSKAAKSNGVVGPTAMQTGKNSNGDGVVTMFTEKNMGSILHEGRHGGDIARGNLEFNTTGGYTVSHEVSAYKAQYAWSGSLSYVPHVNFSNQVNLVKLTGGIKSFQVTITNMNNITPKVVNSMVDKPGLMQQLIYPPKGANGNPLIPLNIWNR